jgi:hypothetical protein
MNQLNGELAAAARAALASGGTLRDAARALRDDRARHVPAITAMLCDIATSEELAAAIAGDSYWHSNGFAKLNLYRSQNPEFRLRLHIWPGPWFDRPIVAHYQNVHNHRWPFASIAVCGHLRITSYEEIGIIRQSAGKKTAVPQELKDVPYRMFAYETPDGASFGRLRPRGDVWLRTMGGFDHGARDVYDCSTDELHAVMANDRTLTATVVIQGPTEVDATATIYQRTDRIPLEDTGASLTAADVARLVWATLDAMRTDGWG